MDFQNNINGTIHVMGKIASKAVFIGIFHVGGYGLIPVFLNKTPMKCQQVVGLRVCTVSFHGVVYMIFADKVYR